MALEGEVLTHLQRATGNPARTSQYTGRRQKGPQGLFDNLPPTNPRRPRSPRVAPRVFTRGILVTALAFRPVVVRIPSESHRFLPPLDRFRVVPK
eukprot:483922-Prorocentrum_minimum.AAC.2